MNKIILLFTSVLLLVGITGCSNSKEIVDLEKYNLEEPKEVIKAYFDSLNAHDEDTFKKLITGDETSPYFSDDVGKFKLLDIKDDTDNSLKNSYLNNGMGSIKKPYDVICFSVYYKVKYKGLKSDEDRRFVTLIKENENSPWLIDEIGQA